MTTNRDTYAPNPYHRVPLGVGQDGNEVVWDMEKNPHLLISGGTGSGKSVLAFSIFDYLKQNAPVECIGLEHLYYNHLPPREVFLSNTTHTLMYAMDRMKSRYIYLTRNPESSKFPFAPLVVFIEDVCYMANRHSLKVTDDAVTSMLAQIVRLGRAVSIHVVVLTQMISVLPEAVTDLVAHIKLGSSCDIKVARSSEGAAIIRKNERGQAEFTEKADEEGIYFHVYDFYHLLPYSS